MGNANIEDKIQRLQDRRKMINILFVLDATQSMARYIPRVSQSIVRIIEDNRLRDAQTKLRFGLAVYRDYPDSVNKQLFEITPLTANEKTITDKLDELWVGSVAQPMPEAQYYGLINGIQKAGFHPDNSNVAVLIGDCGNHREDPGGFDVDKAVDALVKNNINLTSFQVVYGNHPAYRDFNFDVQDYLRKAALKQVVDQSLVKLEQSTFENTYKLVYPDLSEENRSLYMFGRFTHASENQPMDPAILEENIVDALNQYLLNVDNSITIFRNMLEGTSVIDDAFVEWLRSKGWSEEDIMNLRRMGEITARGYLSTKFPGKQIEVYNPVVFMSSNEKQQIIRMFQELTIGNLSITERKKALQDAFLLQTQKMLGNDSESIILNMTIDEIWGILLAVPFTGSPSIRNMRLSTISQLPDTEFRRFYYDFEKKAKGFIGNDYRRRQFKLGDATYYWIPLEDIPGNE